MDVTWKLKEGMKWSDGQPITCADVEATWKWVMDKDQVGLYAGTVGYEDITAIDGGTGTDCVMHYKKHYSRLPAAFSFILPKHYIETIPVKDAPTKLYPLKDPKSGVYSGCYIPTDDRSRRADHLRAEPELRDRSSATPVSRQARSSSTTAMPPRWSRASGPVRSTWPWTSSTPTSRS